MCTGSRSRELGFGAQGALARPEAPMVSSKSALRRHGAGGRAARTLERSVVTRRSGMRAVRRATLSLVDTASIDPDAAHSGRAASARTPHVAGLWGENAA